MEILSFFTVVQRLLSRCKEQINYQFSHYTDLLIGVETFRRAVLANTLNNANIITLPTRTAHHHQVEIAR